ncbi:MAG: glycosyltransferase family A protein [Chthoniobacteraceae bacterium]|nr:glycosyltransferase family A protein [Chthoniobacteraceae bacterium]
MPRVSICIPAFRAEKYLPQALESVRCQTFTDWELIVTEDGSRDGTEALVRAFAQSVPQPVRYQRHEVNRGLPATRNTGIGASAAEVVALLDADDCWRAGHLETALGRLLGTGADLAHAGSVLFESATGRELETRAPSPGAVERFPLSLFVGEYLIQPSSVVLRKSLWERVGGFDPSFRYVEDAEMWMRCARAGARFVYTGEATCMYRKHGGALSANSPEMAIACARAFEKQADWEAIPRAVRRGCTRDAWTSAARMLQRNDPRRAADCLLRAWRVARAPHLPAWAAALRVYAFLAGR